LFEGYALRVARGALDRGPGESAEPDLWQPPAALNAVLTHVVGLEAFAIPAGVPLPFGLSILAVARAV
jgi:hypothetical protein